MQHQEQRLTRVARPGRLYLAGLGAALCQAILALILIAQWQGHKQISAAPVGLAIISVPLTMALIGFVLYAARSKQSGGAELGLARAVAPTGAVAPIQVAAPIAEATPPPPAPATVAPPPDPDTLAVVTRQMWAAETEAGMLQPVTEAARAIAEAASATVYLRTRHTDVLQRVAQSASSPWAMGPHSLPLSSAGVELHEVRGADGYVAFVPLDTTAGRDHAGVLRVAAYPTPLTAAQRHGLAVLAGQAEAALRSPLLHTHGLAGAGQVDRLTGLPDRDQLQALLAREVGRADRFGRTLSIVLLDLDNFAQVNILAGLAGGDTVLAAVGAALQKELRAWDVVARGGSDEFTVLLPETDLEDALGIAERLCRSINVGMSGQTTLKRLDIKAGVASFPLCGRSPEDLIGAASEALSRTKGEGRNRVAGATVEILPPEAVAAVPTALDAVGLATVEAFAIAVDAKDAYTQGHSQRVSTYSEAIGRAMDLPEVEVQHLRLAGLLHDVGKIGVPDAILTKLGALTDSEYAILQQHTVMGHRMVLAVPPLRTIAGAVRHHHERWDGAGYPDGITAAEIPRDAAIVMVADSFDAMTSSRTYRPALRLSEARRRVREGSGTQFDPRVVEAFERAFEQGTLRPLSPGGTLPLSSTYVARASHGITAPQK